MRGRHAHAGGRQQRVVRRRAQRDICAAVLDGEHEIAGERGAGLQQNRVAGLRRVERRLQVAARVDGERRRTRAVRGYENREERQTDIENGFHPWVSPESRCGTPILRANEEPSGPTAQSRDFVRECRTRRLSYSSTVLRDFESGITDLQATAWRDEVSE